MRSIRTAILCRWIWVAGFAAAACLVAAGTVQAQRATLAVLGLTSEEGDDRLAAELTTALRDSVAADAELRLHKSRVSLSQMTVLHDCEISEAGCRARIGAEIGADQVLYGTVRRSGSRHEVELKLFASKDGSERSEKRALALTMSNPEQRAAYTASMLESLLAPPAPEPEPAPEVAARPPAAAPPVIARPRPEPEPIEPAAEDSGEGWNNDWLGWSLIGVAAVSTGLTIFSWTQIEQAADDPNLVAYRKAIGAADPQIEDACAEADADTRHGGLSAQTLADVREACARGETFDVLQYVFLGAALVSAGTGVYFLLDDETDASERAAGVPRVTASVGPSSGSLNLRLRF